MEETIAAGEERFRAELAYAFPAIRELLGTATTGRIYGINKLGSGLVVANVHDENPDAEYRWFEQYLQIGIRTAALRLDAPRLTDDFDAWWWMLRRKFCPVVSLHASALRDAALLPRSRDPYLINSLGSSYVKSAVSYGKQQSTSGEAVALAWHRTGDDLRTFVVAAADTIESVFATVLSQAALSNEFLSLHGTPWVKPLETLGLQVWIDTVRAGDAADLAAIAGALSAVECGDLERVTVLKGLAAAELIAVLAGRAPETLSRKEATLDKEIRQWAAAAGASVAIRADLIPRARSVVQRVLADPRLPERLWHTDAWRRAWRDSIVELERRLSRAVEV